MYIYIYTYIYIYIYIRVKRGTKTDPCGTSQVFSSLSEKTSISMLGKKISLWEIWLKLFKDDSFNPCNP